MGAVRFAFAVVLCAWLAFPILDLDATRLSGTDRVAFVGLALTAASLAAIPLGLLVAALAQPEGRRLSRTFPRTPPGLDRPGRDPRALLGTLGVGLLAGLFFASSPRSRSASASARSPG
jgi:hypothetical protein